MILIITKKIWDKSNFLILDKKKYIVKKKIEKNFLKKLKPKIIFFIHWSKLIDKELFEKYLCIQFHTSDLPFGRGGSPVQNLILLGLKKTKITAFKINDLVDGGPYCLKRNLILSGKAESIYKKIENTSVKMIKLLSEKKIIKFKKQKGKIFEFKRRKPKENILNLKKLNSLKKIYDYIRMLDATGYKNANLKIGSYILEFKNAKIYNSLLKTDVLIKRKK